MSIKIKTYVLCKSDIDEIGIPMVFPNHNLAYKAMEKQFNEKLDKDSWHSEDETNIYSNGSNGAQISSNKGIKKWQIFDCEMEIDNFHEFLSAFEIYLGQYSREYEEFVKNIPQSLAMAASLSDKLQEMQTLLKSAMPYCSIPDNLKKLINGYIINGKKDIEYWDRCENLNAENIADKIAERNEKLEKLLFMETIDAGLLSKLIETETDDELIVIYEEILEELITTGEEINS